MVEVNGQVQGTINRSFRDLSVLSPTKVTEFGSGIWNRHGIRELGGERRDTRPLRSLR